jgi:hypothetical protein
MSSQGGYSAIGSTDCFVEAVQDTIGTIQHHAALATKLYAASYAGLVTSLDFSDSNELSTLSQTFCSGNWMARLENKDMTEVVDGFSMSDSLSSGMCSLPPAR